jgi:glyoxylase-like metal-dependent hydrolase (beta-lactamase superfamily II)
MTSWMVGEARVVRIVDLELDLPAGRPVPDWCVPAFADARGDVRLAFSAFAIASAGTRIVVDPWLANDGPRDRPGAADVAQRLLGALADAGFAPEEVDAVVNTHLDGIGWNTRPSAADDAWVPSFPNARYHWSAVQVEHHRADERLRPLFVAGLVDPIEPGDRLTDAVTVEDAPGHEAGHLAVRIQSDGATAVIPGHLFLSPLQVADPGIPNDLDPATAAATRVDLLTELATREGLLLSPLLGGPGGGVVRRSGTGWRLDVSAGSANEQG